MTSPFLAKPPLPAWKGSYGGIRKHVSQLSRGFIWILWQTIIPFNPRPEEPQPPPEPTTDLDDAQIDLCQAIFDQAEARRTHLEQKAQWTFAIIIFLVPLLASIFVFLFRSAPSGVSRIVAIVFLLISGSFLLLGFISVVRAISVQARETLFLGALIDPQQQQFRTYNKSFHARGLLYCASMNTAMNDHIAQFVKGAHILTASAVIALLVASVPAGVAYSDYMPSPTRISIIGPVSVASSELKPLHDQIVELQDMLAKLEENNTEQNQFLLLQGRVTKLEKELNALEKVISVRSSKRAAKIAFSCQ